jgi:diguanylate cyclase (GGDEF)-like protein
MLSYVTMNAFGIIILLFFLGNQLRAGRMTLDDKLFNGILITTIVEQAMDAGQWLLDGVFFPGSYYLQIFCYTLGHAIAPLIICLWAMYCDLRTRMDERGLKRRLPLYLLPIALHWMLLIANLFTPLVFRIDEAHVYHRDRFFFVYMVLMFAYGIVSVVMVTHKALHPSRSLERTEFRYMALFLIPPFLGGALQWLFYGLSLIWLCSVLSIIMVYTNVLSRQISLDSLTGLNNRRKLNRYLDLKINSAEADPSLFLMMMDADHFKYINDAHGHSVGDQALIAISDILKSLDLGKDCFLARLGGDEFVILSHEKNGVTPDSIKQQIQQRVDTYNAMTNQPFKISLSIGCAHFDPVQINTTDALLNAADQSMYQMKAKRQKIPK